MQGGHTNHSLWAKQDHGDIKADMSWHPWSPKTSGLLRKVTRILLWITVVCKLSLMSY